MAYWQSYPEYVPVAEKKAKAEKARKALAKKRPDLKPVIIEGTKLARTWWGKAWNRNLESYADYSNRIGRGKSYVKHGAVLHLEIQPGLITALVQGSRSKPYQISMEIQPPNRSVWKAIQEACGHRIESMEALLAGHLPEDVGSILTAQRTGMFPSPGEIRFDCSCPDWASMCKHVAAVLYGVGARLDNDPSLFFTLRSVEMQALVSAAVTDQARKLTKLAGLASANVLADADLSAVFGIDLGGSETVMSKPDAKKIEKPKTSKPTPAAPAKRKKKVSAVMPAKKKESPPVEKPVAKEPAKQKTSSLSKTEPARRSSIKVTQPVKTAKNTARKRRNKA